MLGSWPWSVGSPNGTGRLCRLLDDHRVLTTAQVADVGFTGERRARMRLAELYALDILDRFRPQSWGKPDSVPLGPRPPRRRPRRRRDRRRPLRPRRGGATLAHDLAASQRLAHLVGLNGFFTGLLRSARTRPGCYLDEWWSERRCAREWGEVVRPDGYGVWTEHGTALPFLLEYDNGTEPLDRLAAKLAGYARLAAAAGHPNWVLFTFPGPRRERDARRVLAHPGVPVATAWRPPGTVARRRHLAARRSRHSSRRPWPPRSRPTRPHPPGGDLTIDPRPHLVASRTRSQPAPPGS